MPLAGTHHRAGDDAWNIALILATLLASGGAGTRGAVDGVYIDGVISPGMVTHGAMGRQEHDLEGIKQRLAAMFTLVPDMRCTLEDMPAEGDRVSIRYSFEGRRRVTPPLHSAQLHP